MANHCGGLEEALVLGRQPVDTCRQHRLHCGWHLDVLKGLGEAVGSQLTREYTGLYQRLDALLQKEGITRCAGDEELCEGYQTDIISEQRPQELVGARRG